jgi:hypothetical protein
MVDCLKALLPFTETVGDYNFRRITYLLQESYFCWAILLLLKEALIIAAVDSVIVERL